MSNNNDSQQGESEGEEPSATDGLSDVVAALDATDLTDTNISSDNHDKDDEDFFKPPPKKEECPLCLLPFPNEGNKTTYYNCCGKTICSGCMIKHSAVRWWTNRKRAAKDPPEPPLVSTCPFCRADSDVPDKVNLQRLRKRMVLNDPEAFDAMAYVYANGQCGLPRDEDKAVALFLRAAELGSAEACFRISFEYRERGSLGQDHSKYINYFKMAAKRGHVGARHNLGGEEYDQGNFELAVRHWMISAAAGADYSLKAIGDCYRVKQARKDQYEEALRTHQKAKRKMSSDERKMAKKVKMQAVTYQC